ncbi:hypothetical protein AGMMS49975_08150 [Clostridia bacterium]|nr:hypothetical protein AGMMS49975_08150 [Clostridia bacterium]
MNIDYEKIKAAFPEKAWAYAESLDHVRIGKWDGETLKFEFYYELDADLLLSLRVFTKSREIKISGGKLRDTADYSDADYIPELAKSLYYMYGENAEETGNYIKLWEERGGEIYFPKKLSFSENKVGLMLGICNFVRYNPVPVCPKGADTDFGLSKSGAGALEVIDYAYTGFYYGHNKTEVKL